MPFSLFRRKRQDQGEQAPRAAAAPNPQTEAPADPPAAGTAVDPTKPKRRRGSRGGRGRSRKPAAEKTDAQAKPKATATKSAQADKPAKKTDVKVGDRVVIDAEMNAKMKMYVAEEINVGSAAKAAPKKAPDHTEHAAPAKK